jgi:hypothetical protein
MKYLQRDDGVIFPYSEHTAGLKNLKVIEVETTKEKRPQPTKPAATQRKKKVESKPVESASKKELDDLSADLGLINELDN